MAENIEPINFLFCDASNFKNTRVLSISSDETSNFPDDYNEKVETLIKKMFGNVATEVVQKAMSHLELILAHRHLVSCLQFLSFKQMLPNGDQFQLHTVCNELCFLDNNI